MVVTRSREKFRIGMGALVMLAGLATTPVAAAEPHSLGAGYLWFVSGHGINLDHIVDNREKSFATVKSVPRDPSTAVASRAMIANIRGFLAQYRASEEEIVVPAGSGPGSDAVGVAARVFRALGPEAAGEEIALVVGFDARDGQQRTVLHSARDGRLLDLAGLKSGKNGELSSLEKANFVPLYSVEDTHLRIHFKSDTQRYPAIDRSALAPVSAGWTPPGSTRNPQGLRPIPGHVLQLGSAP